MIHSHPSIEQLTEFVSGSLKLSFSLGVSGHLEYCKDCQKQVSQLQKVGAALFSKSDYPAQSELDVNDLLSSVFDRIDTTEPTQVEDLSTADQHNVNAAFSRDETSVDAAAGGDNTEVPKMLKQFFSGDYDSLKWITLTPSFKICTLLKDIDGTQIALSRVKPGGNMPHHRHFGDELTLVLEGSFSDETGLFGKGDYILRNSDDKHNPIVTLDSECICLMVLNAPVQFTGFFTRWLNPFLRLQFPGQAA